MNCYGIHKKSQIKEISFICPSVRTGGSPWVLFGIDYKDDRPQLMLCCFF